LEADPFLQCLPSKIAAAAVALANHTLGMPMWTTKFQQKIGYGLEDLKEIVLELNKLHKTSATMTQQALRDKYKGSKWVLVERFLFSIGIFNVSSFLDTCKCPRLKPATSTRQFSPAHWSTT
jgi:Cyclin, C-terminal domain